MVFVEETGRGHQSSARHIKIPRGCSFPYYRDRSGLLMRLLAGESAVDWGRRWLTNTTLYRVKFNWSYSSKCACFGSQLPLVISRSVGSPLLLTLLGILLKKSTAPN